MSQTLQATYAAKRKARRFAVQGIYEWQMNSGRDYVAVKARFFSSIQTDSSNNCYKMGLKINNNENRTTASPCAEKYARKRGMICVSER